MECIYNSRLDIILRLINEFILKYKIKMHYNHILFLLRENLLYDKMNWYDINMDFNLNIIEINYFLYFIYILFKNKLIQEEMNKYYIYKTNQKYKYINKIHTECNIYSNIVSLLHNLFLKLYVKYQGDDLHDDNCFLYIPELYYIYGFIDLKIFYYNKATHTSEIYTIKDCLYYSSIGKEIITYKFENGLLYHNYSDYNLQKYIYLYLSYIRYIWIKLVVLYK